MKNLFYPFVFLLIASCQSNTVYITEEYPGGSKKVVYDFTDETDSTYTKYHFYQNGEIKLISEFENALRNGIEAQYYPNGQRMYIANFVDNKINGEVNEWYDDGTIKSEREFYKGQLTALANYYPNGQLIGDVEVVNGRIVKGVYFYENGNFRSKGSFRYGSKINTWYAYDSAGVLTDSTYYGDPVGDRIRQAKEQNEPDQR